jgi:prepilin-type N-terminal cleavage/methylation domain-containing protein
MIKTFTKNKKGECGMTLVETLISIAIMAILVLAVTSLLVNTSKSEKRNRIITEVEYQASAIIYEIAQSVRNSSAITSPAVGATSTSLTLALASIPAEDPTVFSAPAQTMLVSRAGGGDISLSSQAVIITNLLFENISAPDTKGAVRITLAVEANNPNNKPELEYSTSRTTTITLR